MWRNRDFELCSQDIVYLGRLESGNLPDGGKIGESVLSTANAEPDKPQKGSQLPEHLRAGGFRGRRVEGKTHPVAGMRAVYIFQFAGDEKAAYGKNDGDCYADLRLSPVGANCEKKMVLQPIVRSR